ncbi:hypothetical protein DYB32_007873, partial [Aphanomyces invadans]
PLSPSGSTQQQAAILRDAPATPPSPSSFSQPSVSISATADLHYTHQDYSASIDATPMPRYLGRYAEGDINVGLNRALPRGDLGRSQVRLDVPLPQQASAALNPDSPPSSPMSDGHRQFPAAPASPGSASLSLRPNDVDLAPPMAEQSYTNAVVWGTNVNVAESMRVFRVFLQNFVPRELDGSDESYYRKVLRQIHLTQEGVFNLDCQHLLQSTDETKVLYTQLLHFPQVLVRILDMVVQDAYKAMFSDDPDAVNFFRDSVFGGCMRHGLMDYSPRWTTDTVHAQSCRHCQSRNSMEIVHNRCAFTDKQLVKMQETPDAIPEGETPYTVRDSRVMLFCFDDLVDDVRPGDKVQVTGIYRAVPLRATVKQRVVKSVFKTYVDVVHFRKVDELYNQGGGFRDANAVDAITNAKLGVLCQLFGGARKGESGPDKKHTRSDLNVLLCGDPGTSKSQLLSYVHKLAPRGIYTSGKGSSAVGLTASVVRDMETGDFVLESGALVLSDEGICCIDEFDKMSDSARSVLHEVMEQQTVSIAKAGIICSLNARASILASANPIESRYNPAKSVIENINILPTLLSRYERLDVSPLGPCSMFDLIYLILDRPNADADRQLARHIVSMYYDGYTVSATTRTSEVIKMSVLSEYIAYAKKHIHPKLTEAAAADLVAGYLGLRRMGNNRKNITATPRQLESLIRIAEALAKMKLSATGTCAIPLRLMHVATQKAAMDPRTGTIDMDMITTGLATLDRQTLQTMVADLKQILDAEGSMSLGDAKRKLDEARGTETKPTDFQSAIRLLEEDSVVQITHGTLRYMADHRGA